MELTDDVRHALAIKREAERRAQEKRILREKALIDGVFAALRPPDDAADLGVGQVLPGEALGLGQPRPQRRLATEQQPSLSLEELLLRPDYQECLAMHIVSRADLHRLLCTSNRLRAALLRSRTICYLGLFRTEFGFENCCKLVPHQERSLRQYVMWIIEPRLQSSRQVCCVPFSPSRQACMRGARLQHDRRRSATGVGVW